MNRPAFERNVKLCGDVFGVIGFLGRLRTKSMIDVDRRDLTTGVEGENEQGRGVGATGEGTRDGRAGGGKRAAQEQVVEEPVAGGHQSNC